MKLIPSSYSTGTPFLASMASWYNPDLYTWIQNLPTISQWKSNSMSVCICSSGSSALPNLNFSVSKSPSATSVTFSILANFSLPISLWTSKPASVSSNSSRIMDGEGMKSLLINFIQDVLRYGPSKNIYPITVPRNTTQADLKDMFNFSFLTLAFLVCIYEAPAGLRCKCLSALKDHLTASPQRRSSVLLMRLLGSNLEEAWMRSFNLAITNWKMEFRAANKIFKCPSPIFSSAVSSFGSWKVQFYCPIICMDVENSSNNADEKLMLSLNYHQLEGVIQLNYKVLVRDKWVEVLVDVDNIRLDVIPLVNEGLLKDRGAGAAEKHFPSRISVRLTPTLQTEILSVSVSKSSENPQSEIETAKSVEGSFELPNQVGFTITAGETRTTVLKPWKFEEYVHGHSGNLNWFLYDSGNGREVFSSKPSKVALFQHNAWFKNRYASAYRPFTRRGGVIFAADEYSERVHWKVDRALIGKSVEWEISGFIGLTYWPNTYRTFYNETRRAEFREKLYLTLA